jgi:hypothetical protein
MRCIDLLESIDQKKIRVLAVSNADPVLPNLFMFGALDQTKQPLKINYLRIAPFIMISGNCHLVRRALYQPHRLGAMPSLLPG